jgi:hypothetical protein
MKSPRSKQRGIKPSNISGGRSKLRESDPQRFKCGSRPTDTLREIDVYVVDAKNHRLAIEVKLGEFNLNSERIRQELARDTKLLKQGKVDLHAVRSGVCA